MGEIQTNVAGVTYSNEDGTSRQDILRGMTKNYKIKLRDEASEEFPEAIGVYNARGKRVGFLPKDVAIHVRECGVDHPDMLDAKIDFIGHDIDRPYGMTITIEGKLLEDLYLNKNPIPYRYVKNLPFGDPERRAYEDARWNAIRAKEKAIEEAAQKAAEEAKARAQREHDALVRKWEAERHYQETMRREEEQAQKRKAIIILTIIVVVVGLTIVRLIFDR